MIVGIYIHPILFYLMRNFIFYWLKRILIRLRGHNVWQDDWRSSTPSFLYVIFILMVITGSILLKKSVSLVKCLTTFSASKPPTTTRNHLWPIKLIDRNYLLPLKTIRCHRKPPTTSQNVSRTTGNWCESIDIHLKKFRYYQSYSKTVKNRLFQTSILFLSDSIIVEIIISYNCVQIYELVANTRQLSHAQMRRRKTFFAILRIWKATSH